MIVSASYKTDIPAFYGRWFLNRLAAGRCEVANPYGGKPFCVSLAPGEVAGFVFWTRNPGPFGTALRAVEARGEPFVVQFTITGYPRALDAATIAAADAVGLAHDIARTYGPRTVVWRYDPVVISSLTPADWHRENFRRLAESLSGATDEVAVSFAQIYRKTRLNLDRAAAAHDFRWRDPEAGEKHALLRDLGETARGAGMIPTLCGQPALLGGGVAEARCIDSARLSDIAGRALTAAPRPHRKTCRCAASKDIGEYDSCPHGCAYCYAVRSRDLARRRHKSHDANGERLIATNG
jgi:hypothetical protein